MSEFVRYEALGNDYVVIDPSRTDLAVNGDVARALCDRHRGIGADGVLCGPRIGGGVPTVRIFNSDGSECAKSGNGLRIFTRYLRERGHVDRDRFIVRTLAGEAGVEVLDLAAGIVAVDMGTFTFDSERVPVAGPARPVIRERLAVAGQIFSVTCVNVGNPHCVVEVADAGLELAMAAGPLISRHPMFPEGTNVQFLSIVDRSTIAIQIWERGSGYTLASGSSSCAAASVAYRLGLVDRAVTVRMPGGELSVQITAGNGIRMTGEAQPIVEGTFAPAFRRRLAALAGG